MSGTQDSALTPKELMDDGHDAVAAPSIITTAQDGLPPDISTSDTIQSTKELRGTGHDNKRRKTGSTDIDFEPTHDHFAADHNDDDDELSESELRHKSPAGDILQEPSPTPIERTEASKEDAPVPAHSKAPTNFMDLPLELREQVYEYCLAEYPTEVGIPHDQDYSGLFIPVQFHEPSSPPGPDGNESATYDIPTFRTPMTRLPSIAFTEVGVFNELVLTCLRTRTLNIGSRFDLLHLTKYVDRVAGTKGFASIRDVAFKAPMIQGATMWSALGVLVEKAATSIQNISILVSPRTVADNDKDIIWKYVACPMKTVLQRYPAYACVFELPNVRCLTIRGQPATTVDGSNVYDTLVSWLREGFEQRGLKARVEFEQLPSFFYYN